MITEIFLILLMLVLSALYSGSEITFVVANRLKIELKAQKKTFIELNAIEYANNPQKFFIISLVGTNISNVAFSTLAAIVLASMLNIHSIYILIITASILLIFGEIIPKVFFRENADRFISLFTVLLYMSNKILSPIIIITSIITKHFMKIFKVETEPEKYYYTEKEVHSLLKESEPETYLSKTFELKDTPLKEAAIPRIEIIGVPKTIAINDLYSTFIKSNHSKILVYDDSIDNIIGYIDIKSLIPEVINIDPLIKEIMFVPETKTCSEMLHEFITKNQSVAVVIDEFGGTSGIVTISDILEEILGEIEEEHEINKLVQQKLSTGKYIFSGRLEIDFVNQNYGLEIPSGNYVTVSGYIIENIGRVPKSEEVFEFGNYKFKIIKAKKTKIDLVELEVK